MSNTKLATNAHPFLVTISPTLGPNGGRQYLVGAARTHIGERTRLNHHPTVAGDSVRSQGEPVVIKVAPVARGRFRASFDGRVLVEASSTPFLDAARVLAGEGVDPATRIVMRHEGQSYDALISTVGAAAKLTVKESTRDGKPRFGNWHPYGGPGVPVPSPISQTELAGVSPHPAAPALPAEREAMNGEAEMRAQA
jgi:hypothetical protein